MSRICRKATALFPIFKGNVFLNCLIKNYFFKKQTHAKYYSLIIVNIYHNQSNIKAYPDNEKKNAKKKKI